MRKLYVFFNVSLIMLIFSYSPSFAQPSYLAFEGTYQTEDGQSILKITKIQNTKRQYSLSGSMKSHNLKWIGVGILNDNTLLGTTSHENSKACDFLLIKHKPGGLIKYKIAKKTDELYGNENFSEWFRIGD